MYFPVRVGFVLLHPFTQSLASYVRVKELAISLKKLDAEPFIFTPYEKTQVTREGIHIIHIPSVFSKWGLQTLFYQFSRRLYYSRPLQKFVTKLVEKKMEDTAGMFDLYELLKRYQLDVVQAEQDNAALLLLPLRDKLDIPIVLDLHGIWPEELVAAGTISKGSKEYAALQNIMQHIVANVDLVIALGEEMKRYLDSNYDSVSSKTVVAPPGGRPQIEEIPERPLPPKIIYAGTVTYRKHVDLFVESMPFIRKRQKKTAFFITRKGDLLRQIQKLAEKLHVAPEYFWFPNVNEMFEFMAQCHIGVLPTTNDTSSRISMPSKLFDYFSVGLPVVVNEVGGWTEIIRKNKAGVLTADDPKDFAMGILQLLDNPSMMSEYGKRGLTLLRTKYLWDNSARVLFNEYKKLINQC